MKKSVIIMLIYLLLMPLVSLADNYEGTGANSSYLIILVHGLNDSAGVFRGEKAFGDLKHYLESEMGINGKVFCYSFSNNRGSTFDQGRELGDRAYNNPSPEMAGKCWLQKARDDYRQIYANEHYNEYGGDARRVPDSLVPNKYILITHSMGNYSARAYIYSNQVYDNGFYGNDVDKVVFIAPPFLGSDMAIVSYKAYWNMIKNSSANYNNLISIGANIFSPNNANIDLVKALFDAVTFLNNNPYYPYLASLDYAGQGIYWPRIGKMIIDETTKVLVEKKTWEPSSQALCDLLPNSNAVIKLKAAKALPSELEPAYSVVYAKGVPTYDGPSTYGMHYANIMKDVEKDKNALDTLHRYAWQNSYPNIFDLDYQKLTIFHPGFWQIDSSEGKLLSLLMAKNGEGFFTNDGDGLVPVYSALGNGISYLSGAKKYPVTFKNPALDSFLGDQLPEMIAGTEAIIYTMAALTGTPPNLLWPFRLLPAGTFVVEVANHYNDINYDIEAHGNILKQYDLIKTALLDTPAVFTITDLVGSTETTAASSEGRVFSASAAAPPPGLQSLKIKTITENRKASGLVNMPIPMTLDGQRMYASNITVTKPPKRLAGKLNYLFPALMQRFEYSFNFAAWQPITNVNAQTGEFALDDLPFAEGQNVLAIRTTNGVGINNHQLLNITLNTIPILPSGFQPVPNSFTNNNQPNFKVKFAKSAYSAEPLENISITSAKLIRPDAAELDITSDVRTTLGGETYDRNVLVEYSPSSPLDDGEYKIVVVANSNVGVAQALWTVNIDTRAPNVAVEPLKPYSARSPTTIKYTATDEATTALKTARCDLYDQSGNHVTQIATDEALNGGEHAFNWDGKKTDSTGSTDITDGTYKVRIKVFDLAGNFTVAETPITIDSTPPKILSAGITPNPLSSKSNEQKLELLVSEKSQLFIKMTNLADGSTKAFLAQASGSPANGQTGIPANYTWRYDNPYAPGPPDGIYDMELEAQDEAGNRGEVFKIANVRIDRTPPTVYAQATLPYVLSNSGANPYSTNLSYKIKAEGPVSVKIKLYHETTHELLEVWDNAPNSLTEVNQLPWSGNSADYPKGSYRFQIIAADDLGNESSSFANCVKDGIAPVISFPAEDNAQVSGVVALRGTAIDPDWTNSKPFKSYRIYYAAAGTPLPVDLGSPGAEWKTEAIEVPISNRGTGSLANGFTGIRPLQNDSTLAYLYTNSLANGIYTVMVVVDEDGGETPAPARSIKSPSRSWAGWWSSCRSLSPARCSSITNGIISGSYFSA